VSNVPNLMAFQTLEVRGTVKAKWVRVELRKIEVLPGGGQNNTFSETIGERPIALWSSNQDEFSELTSVRAPPCDHLYINSWV
jgi:hypothetical protein